MNILVTGWSGVGKSTICRELVAAGHPAFDTDKIPGLCGWVDKQTGENFGKKYPTRFSDDKYDWRWDEQTLLLNLKTTETTFFCGNANNAFDFYHMFGKVFLLDLPEAEQRRRMMARTEHNFGQDIATQDMVIHRQRTLVSEAQALGAIVIDASPSPGVVMNDILARAL